MTISGFTVQGPVQPNHGDVSFALVNGDDRWLYIVSHEALQDAAAYHGNTPTEQSLDFFEQFQDRIMAIALRYTTQAPPEHPILITTAELNG